MTDATNTRMNKQDYLDYMLRQMEEIRKDNGHILAALAQLANMEVNIGTPDSRAMAMGNISEARESTNRKLLAMYQDVYNDLKYHNEGSGTRRSPFCMQKAPLR